MLANGPLLCNTYHVLACGLGLNAKKPKRCSKECHMKTLKFIGMASLAVVLCVDFTACSKDNDDLKRTKTILVKTAGTLSTLIPAEEIEQITNLTLSGYINGDDVRFIQKMYNLTKADFTDLHIIGGGGTYETYPDYEYKYTRDNVSLVSLIRGNVMY